MRPFLVFGLTIVFSGLLIQSGRAQSGQASIQAVVVSAADPSQLEAAQGVAEQLEQGLVDRGVLLLSATEARARFEAVHSTEPVVLDKETLVELRKQVDEATRLLALNRLREALDATHELRELSASGQDYLRRELSQAQELFDVCVVTASQIAAAGDQLQAYRHMLRCAQTFPGLTPVPEYHPPEVRELYDSVLEDVEQAKPATLLVRSAGTEPCLTRVNGISWGEAPAQITMAPHPVRVQLECAERPGRVHHMSLRAGFNRLLIDPVFDRALRSGPPRLRLLYESLATLANRRRRDGETLARALNVTRLVMVEGGAPMRVHQLDSFGQLLHTLAVDPVDPSSLATVLAELSEGAHLHGNAPAVSSEQTPGPVSAVALGQAGEEVMGQPPAQVGVELSVSGEADALYVPALPVLEPSADLAWLSPLTIGIGYALSIAGSAFALSERYFVRRDSIDQVFDLDHYNDTGSLGVGFMVGGAMIATAAELLTLPAADGVPAAAWVAGAVGVVAGVAGLGLSASDNSCTAADDRQECIGIERDPLLGPLLLVQSVPLLAVPATYLLAEGLGERGLARVEWTPGGMRLAISGRF